MKKLIAGFIAVFTCIFGTFVQINAADVGMDSTGYSNYEDLPEEQKEILDHIQELDPTFEINGEYVSVEKLTGYIQDGTQQTYGAISPSNMAIYISVSRVNDPGKDTFKVSAVAEWLNVPTVRVQDGFGIAWAGDFAVTSYNAVTSYKGVGVLYGKTSLLNAVPNTGFGYSVECSHYYGQALDWVRIDATLSRNNASGIANICATYDHATVSLGVLGVTVSKTPSCSFSFSGSHDYMTKISSFSY